MLYRLALDVAPFAVFANRKFFLPITNGLISLSAALLSTSKEPSNRTFFNDVRCYLAYSKAFPSGLLGRASGISLFMYSKKFSRIIVNFSFLSLCLIS